MNNYDELDQMLKDFRPWDKHVYWDRKNSLTSQSTLLEVAEYCFEFEKAKRKVDGLKTGTDYKTGLLKYIQDLEHVVNMDSSNTDLFLNISDFYEIALNGRSDDKLYKYDEFLFKHNEKEELVLNKAMMFAIGKGIAIAHILPQLKKDYNAIDNNDYLIEEEEEKIRFDSAGEKYVLLQQLGIIKYLRGKYERLSNAKFAQLLAYITDTKNHKSFENLLSQDGQPNSEHYPYKEKNITKATNIFAKIGIEIGK